MQTPFWSVFVRDRKASPPSGTPAPPCGYHTSLTYIVKVKVKLKVTSPRRYAPWTGVLCDRAEPEGP